MLKIVILLFVSLSVFSQEEYQSTGLHKYVSLEDNKVYDVEIIVFAYNQALPNHSTFKNKAVFDDSLALVLLPKPEDLEYTIGLEAIEPDTTSDEVNPTKFTVPLEDDTNQLQALAWFEHQSEFNSMSKIWDKLSAQQNITPLLHKAWRQTQTEFKNPDYIKLTNMDLDESDDNQTIEQLTPNVIDSDITNESPLSNKFIYPEFSLSGMVALSKGRYMHFGHSLNLFRTYINDNQEVENMVFSLKERRQVKTDQLNYFDSPWFGSIVKITEHTGELVDGQDNESD